MRVRTFVSTQRYFGLEPLSFRRGAGRTLARMNGVSKERARVSVETLREDFRLDRAAGEALVAGLVAGGLLEPQAAAPGQYRLTERFSEFALARVVPPLARARAKELLVQACRLAEQINAEWAHNPLRIEMIAVSGSYMLRNSKVAELTLWAVVKRRAAARIRRLGPSQSKAEGASEIRAALRALSPFIRPHIVTDTATIERPFSVPFRSREETSQPSPPLARWRAWGALRGQGRAQETQR